MILLTDKLNSSKLYSTKIVDIWTLNMIESDYNNAKIILQWIERFERYRSTSDKCLLLLNSHKSHIPLDFIQFCCDHEITPFLLLPHTKYLCQPLNINLLLSAETTLAQDRCDLSRPNTRN